MVDGMVESTPVSGEVSSGAYISAEISSGATIEANIVATGPRGPKGEPGSSDYEQLENIPSIEDVELVGNKTLFDLGFGFADAYDIHQLFR